MNNGTNTDMKGSSDITNTHILHREVYNPLFSAGVTGSMFIIELQALKAV